MARRLTIRLTAQQRDELLNLRRSHPKSYVRERAAAILQVADGKTLGEVAARGLVVHRQLETVSGWVQRYVAEGPQGLEVRGGRGRKQGQPILRWRKPDHPGE